MGSGDKHTLAVDKISIEMSIDETSSAVHVLTEASTYNNTGIEMEALMAVSISCLTIYDMCKSAERTITIERIRLLKKMCGRHNYTA